MDRLADLRRDYKRARLEPEDLGPDPIAAFERWFSEARASEAIEPNAMALGTADEAGTPSVRMVLRMHRSCYVLLGHPSAMPA